MGTVSNALAKSIVSVCPSLSCLVARASMVKSSCISHDFYFRKPRWKLVMMLIRSRCAVTSDRIRSDYMFDKSTAGAREGDSYI